MSSFKTRQIYRGWKRGESFWDAQGMNENLRFIADHLPLTIVYADVARPAAGTEEGEAWINTGTGEYAVWSKNNDGVASWNIYPPARGIYGYNVTAQTFLVNTGAGWQTLLATDKYLVGFEDYDEATDSLILRMSDGTTRSIPMTSMINDAISAAPDASLTQRGYVNILDQSLKGKKTFADVVTVPNHIEAADTTNSATIDVQSAAVFKRTLSTNVTYVFTNAPAAGKSVSFVMELINPGSKVTWPASVKWSGGIAPVLTSVGKDVLGFYTIDGGVSYIGIGLAFGVQ